MTIGVVPSEQRKGLGFKLLQEIQLLLKEKGVSTLFLEVNEKNVSARKLYEKAGFEQVGLRKGYYELNGKKFDALLLKKQI